MLWEGTVTETFQNSNNHSNYQKKFQKAVVVLVFELTCLNMRNKNVFSFKNRDRVNNFKIQIFNF